MVYDLFADHDTDANANARRAKRVLVDGVPVANCFYADTEAGIAKAWASADGGSITVDDNGAPIQREIHGVVTVEER